ncbi:hypothetical protein ISN45_At05g049020 [Arabidopsis thaliana x Arabidopsis arenosa]|uniref:Uncharacterized protein n=2 Tax=Arabidopsis TaxID=3701 RepID=A0A8T2DTH1_ARASU|nr:hypothetical protein ISN45_At05g049020 [Arabidopsis thaliana x Arabidopsis arenosa]KAG7612854.1 hypothetical protein ISN44_As05g048330 [Arabidopsis suecica]
MVTTIPDTLTWPRFDPASFTKRGNNYNFFRLALF